MFSKSVPPLRLELNPSRGLAFAIAATHALAGFASVANPLPAWMKLGMLGVIIFSLFLCRREYLSNPAVKELVLKPGGECEVFLPSGMQPGTVLDSSVVTTWMVILHIKSGSKKRAVTVCRDSVDSESFRMLRVYLRCRY
ncbi:protein YgfX [Methylocaldum sp.]|uniref:protein YgfX n=1 Tax=Methylocaldum sp. TaxID=1969727 RepID=UPI002D2DA2A8|nr:protein YgfX [Methylocaldum sp.]HYE34236.1 protein YgfX [Methylocaldum sp.]